MAARVRSGTKSQIEYLRRLSVVFAVELRLKIVAELYQREMSPTQFHEAFGGGSVTRVDSQVKMLRKHLWLRLVRIEKGGRRRGGAEHFYRAIEPAVFDSDTWSLLPYSVRHAFSWSTLRQFGGQVGEAATKGTIDAQPDCQRSCTTLRLDWEGWGRVIAGVDTLFASVFEEQADARLRAFHTDAVLTPATVALAAFESPEPGAAAVGPGLVECRDHLGVFSSRLSKVLASEVCRQIVAAANTRAISATMFQREFGGDKDMIYRLFRLLRESNWLIKAAEQSGGKRRGGREKFYRATGPAILGEDPWASVPESIKDEPSWKVFEQISERIIEAMRVGTFDMREDRHFTWSLLRLDRQGWANVIAAIDELLAFIRDEQARAKVRLKEAGEKPILMTVATAAFESPRNPAKEP